jgi:Domain of unknown function (DUF5069)
MQSDTWWGDGLRSPHDILGGVKMLAHEVDKVRAELSGARARRDEVEEAILDEVFFSLLGAPRVALCDVVRRAWSECRKRNDEALVDLRQSLESEPEISDAQFIEHAQASDIDNAVVDWLHETLAVSADTMDSINALIDLMVPRAH